MANSDASGEWVTHEELMRVVQMLANQCPTRYYLYADGGTESKRIAVEIYEQGAGFPDVLDAQLQKKGFEAGTTSYTNEFCIFRWEANRRREETYDQNVPLVQAIRALGRYVVHCPYCGLDHSHSGVGLQQSGCENGASPYWVEGGEL